MTDDQIKNLLRRADRTAPAQVPVPANLAAAVRRAAHRRHIRNIAAPIAAAALILFALGTWTWTPKTGHTTRQLPQVALLETQIHQLQARTDAALKLIREVLERDQRQRRLDELEAQLAAIPDPLEEVRKQIDKPACILVYRANQMDTQLNQIDSAVETYNRVIELFPQTQWAEVARRRLSQIQNNLVNKDNSKI